MMTPDETRLLLKAITYSDHRYIGIRPADSVPGTTPIVTLDGKTATSLSYALVTAAEVWPDCNHWQLVATDQLATERLDGWPPRLHAPMLPLAMLAAFETQAARRN